MRAVDVIRKKRDGRALTTAEIDAFVHGATDGSWAPYQVSALLMAVVLRGMDSVETSALTSAMVRSGVKLDLSDIPGPKVDKHSTGGVGDKLSLVVAPLAAACGVVVPMMSGRGLGHTGGTLDKLEAIPGFRVNLSLDEFRAALKDVGCAQIGQTKEIAPADKVLYALRDVTGTVESLPLIAASIMSKKIAEGVGALVLDVKCGKGAFMKTHADAKKLAQALVTIGAAAGVRTRALLTAMDAPLGRAVGNALEVVESLETLKGRGPRDVESLSVQLATHMVHLAGAAPTMEEAHAKVHEALTSGRALEKFRAMVARQGGDQRVVDDYTLLPTAPHQHVVKADQRGYNQGFDAEKVGRAAVELGAGRDRTEDGIDPAVGIIVRVRPGHQVMAGDELLVLHYRDESRLKAALAVLDGACVLAGGPPTLTALVLETIQ